MIPQFRVRPELAFRASEAWYFFLKSSFMVLAMLLTVSSLSPSIDGATHYHLSAFGVRLAYPASTSA
jgi:hypothetical protein